jgi:protein-S-isoprenylcysteine O-methyltransferase Ste14
MKNFTKWQNQENSKTNRVWALMIGALIFLFMIPGFQIFICPKFDFYFGIGSFFNGLGNLIVGITAIVAGGIVGMWTIAAQVTLASGTPFPMLPTKKLVIVGPFQYCRNPMTLGTIIAYAGIAILIGSFSAVVVIAIFAALLICYLKMIEEKELEMRFGKDYVEYKRKTPFIIPIPFGRRGTVR